MAVCLLLALKLNCDQNVCNDDFAEVAEIEPQQVSKMEIEICKFLGFKLYESPVLFAKYKKAIDMCDKENEGSLSKFDFNK